MLQLYRGGVNLVTELPRFICEMTKVVYCVYRKVLHHPYINYAPTLRIGHSKV